MDTKLTIDPKIFEHLIKIREKLPEHAPHRPGSKDGMFGTHSPAGLALLGSKDNLIDIAVELKMSGGCWDTPNINYADMDKGFRELIKKDRIVSGMALIRHIKWDAGEDSIAKIPLHFRGVLHSLRHSFENIENTLWVITEKKYFRVYQPTIGDGGRIGAKEVFVKPFLASDDSILIPLKDKQQEEIIKKREEELEEKRKQKAERAALLKSKKTLVQEIDKKEKEEINLGNGLSFIKGKDRKYFLWQTGKRT
jgi:hypothetical protein